MNKANPFRILIGWTIFILILTLILVYSLSERTSGGEQYAFSSIAIMLIVWLIGSSVIVILVPFFYKSWFSSNKWFILLIISLMLPVALYLFLFASESSYSYVEENRRINGSDIVIKTEYYDNENRFIRSYKFWKNGLKDSTWTTFSKEGKILKQEKYQKDILLHK